MFSSRFSILTMKSEVSYLTHPVWNCKEVYAGNFTKKKKKKVVELNEHTQQAKAD